MLVALEDVIADALKGGEIVRLGDLGTFRVSLSSKGALTEKEYTASLITKTRILFRPGTVLSDALTDLAFTKTETIESVEEDATGEQAA